MGCGSCRLLQHVPILVCSYLSQNDPIRLMILKILPKQCWTSLSLGGWFRSVPEEEKEKVEEKAKPLKAAVPGWHSGASLFRVAAAEGTCSQDYGIPQVQTTFSDAPADTTRRKSSDRAITCPSMRCLMLLLKILIVVQ